MYLVVYTSFGWEVDITEAAEHIGESFAGGYWTGDVPPVPLTMFPASAVIDMQTGVILASTWDIADPADYLTFAAAAAAD